MDGELNGFEVWICVDGVGAVLSRRAVRALVRRWVGVWWNGSVDFYLPKSVDGHLESGIFSLFKQEMQARQ